MRFLFYATHTLYLKSILPVAFEMIRLGHQVTFIKSKPNWYRYSPQKFATTPTRNNCFNKSALKFVSGICGYEDEFNEFGKKIHWCFFPKKNYFDALIGTTKSLDKLLGLGKKIVNGKRIYAVGYQHFPVLLSFEKENNISRNNSRCEELFLGSNPFSDHHRFQDVIKHPDVQSYCFVNFPHLVKVAEENKENDWKRVKELKYVLIFHPGGYRKVLTYPGDNKISSYLKQREFLYKICLPILEAGLIPVVKVHPLYAKFHSKTDLVKIQQELVDANPLFEKIIITDNRYWKFAFEAQAILTFGSSSVYELFAAGLRKVLILNFFGQSRSSKFKMFNQIFVEDIEAYKNFIFNPESLEHNFTQFEGHLEDIFQGYSSLPCGESVKQITDQILKTKGRG